MLKPITPRPQELETRALVLVPVVLVILLLCAATFIASKFQSIKGRLSKILAVVDNRPEGYNRVSPLSARDSCESAERTIPADQEAVLRVKI